MIFSGRGMETSSILKAEPSGYVSCSIVVHKYSPRLSASTAETG